MKCNHLKNGICDTIGKVNEDFCKIECQGGKNLDLWKSRIIGEEDPCKACDHYRVPSCKEKRDGAVPFCLLLTRMTLLSEYLKDNQCPLLKKSNVDLRPQPKRHPARGKNIFMRADKRNIDIVDLFHGQTAFICAGGPSFKYVDKSRLQQPGILTMALNNTAHLFRPTMWTGQDPQYRFMPSIWDDPKIMKFTLLDYRFRRYWDKSKNNYTNHDIRSCPNVFFHRRHSNFIADKWINEDRVVWGTPKDLPEGGHGARSVLVAALHILYFLGFHKVYLVGVDFHMDEKKKYWFDEDRGRGAIINNRRVFHHVNKHLTDLQPHLLKAGFNVFNTNKDSALKAFPHYSLEKAVEESIIDTSESTKGYYVKR